MKSTFCILLCCMVSLMQAQTFSSVIKKKDVTSCQPDSKSPQSMRFTQEFLNARQRLQSLPRQGGTRAVTSAPIGSAGNLYTILNGNVNRVAANSTLNTVAFIHRSNDVLYPQSNRGQFRYDVSYDRGMTWPANQLDIGVLNPSGNQQTFAGRYPNAVIYNPVGNTNPNDAYLAYLGTWLPFDLNGSWDGHFTGAARLNNDTATFTENIQYPNNSDILIATGMCNGAPGVFWAVNFASEPFSSSTENIVGILVFKGFWNNSRNDVDWILQDTIVPPYDISFNGLVQSGSADISFDPTGQFGWIGMVADCIADGVNNTQPVFYSTKDGGATWTGPILIDLFSFDNIVNGLPTSAIYATSPGGDMDLVTDLNGNPHLITIVGGAATDTTVLLAGLRLFDFTYNGAYRPESRWQAIFLENLYTFRGTLAIDEQGAPISETNRPQASLSPDGRKVFAGWLDSDTLATSGGDNSVPNFITRGYDVITGLATPVVNWTFGDPNWDGLALFASVAPTTLGDPDYYIPTVFTEINISGLGTDPAKFHYIQNIKYVNNDFAIDVYPPIITLNDNSPLTVVVNTTFTDPSATASDNVAPYDLTDSITANSNVNENVVGTYEVVYRVTDAAGNEGKAIRIVHVVANPDNTLPVITMIGASTLSVDVCDFFSDPGATATDNVDGDITINIQVSNNLPDPLTPGTYTIDYDVVDGAGNQATTRTRTVIATDLPPVITLNGGDTINVELCNSFVDPGGYAEDKCAGILPLTVSGFLDTNSVGPYTLTYTANDGVNPVVTRNRTVNITPDETPPTIVLSGANPQYVYLGDAYSDPGAAAYDCVNDTLTSSITSDASTSVNTSSRDNYSVTYQVTDAGNNTATTTRTVIVNTEPEPRINYEIFGSVVAFNSDSSLYNPTGWRWDFGDPSGSFSTQPRPVFNYLQNDTFNVCLKVTNIFNQSPFNKPVRQECETIIITAVGISEINIERSFSIYPNPTTGVLSIVIDNGVFENVNLGVFDIVGKEFRSFELGKMPNGSIYMMDLSNSADGVYFIKIQTEQGMAVKRVIMSR